MGFSGLLFGWYTELAGCLGLLSVLGVVVMVFLRLRFCCLLCWFGYGRLWALLINSVVIWISCGMVVIIARVWLCCFLCIKVTFGSYLCGRLTLCVDCCVVGVWYYSCCLVAGLGTVYCVDQFG